jgi:hypothetical protein
MVAELSGKFLFNVENSIDYPTVGDWVSIQCFDNYSLAIIHHILPRKSLLKRKDPGKAVEFQLIAANIDYAFIMQAVDSNFNLNRLERYFGSTAKVTQKDRKRIWKKGVLIANYLNLTKPKKEFSYENPETIIPPLIKSVHLRTGDMSNLWHAFSGMQLLEWAKDGANNEGDYGHSLPTQTMPSNKLCGASKQHEVSGMATNSPPARDLWF